jgi:hypothetical protein
MNPVTVLVTVALEAKRDAIVYVVSEFGVFGIGFDVMRLKNTAPLVALLAGIVIALDNCKTPFFVLRTLPVKVALSCFRLFFALVVGKCIAFLHSLLVHLLTFIGGEQSSTCLGDFISALRRCVGAVGATISLFCSVGFEYLAAVGACSNHGVTSNKIPCLRRWLLLSRQLAPVREQGILNKYTPTELVLQAA